MVKLKGDSMKTKVITLEHVPVEYRVPARKIWAEILEGLQVLGSAACLIAFAYGLTILFYALS